MCYVSLLSCHAGLRGSGVGEVLAGVSQWRTEAIDCTDESYCVMV